MDMLTESSMPMPVKINPPGGYACRMKIRCRFRASYPIRCGTYQGNSAAHCRRKRVDDFHSGIQPPCQSITTTTVGRLVKPRDLLSQYGDNIVRRMARLKSAK
jgi:hypothetical protein